MTSSSLVFHPLWQELKRYLVVEIYDKDGGHVDPRIRIEFRRVPLALADQVRQLVLPCVACQRPNLPVRRREGHEWSHLYYAPTCPIGVRMACARSGPARQEYLRFKDLWAAHPKPKDPQLRMFY